MHQWVAAICQASIQHIQHSVPLFPRCTLDRPVLRDEINVVAPVESDSEMYDDAGSGTQLYGESEDIYEFQESDEEEFYQDISDACQKNLVLESKPGFEVKPAEKCPPLPPRRYPTPASQDYLSDQDFVYDDVSNQHSEYLDVAVVGLEGSHTLAESGTDVNKEERCSWVQQNIPIGQTKAHPQLFVKHEVQNDDNDEEIYDDVGISEELPKAVKLPILQQKFCVGNGGGIQNRIRELEISSSNGCIPIGGHCSNPKTSEQIQYNISTTYKSVNNSEEDTVSSLPQTPTAYHNSKYNISNQIKTNTRQVFKHMKNIENEAKIFSPRAPFTTQRPEIPPRSYLKQ